MTEDILAEFRGNIYRSCWPTNSPMLFAVIEVISMGHYPIIKVKIINMPNFKSSHNLKLGYAAIGLNSIKGSEKVNELNIMDYVKIYLLR